MKVWTPNPLLLCVNLKILTYLILKLYLSAVSEEMQVSLHHTQLPVLLLQASDVGRRTQGSEGTEREIKRPSMTPLKPPDKNKRLPQLAMAKDVEWLTVSPTDDTAVRKEQIKKKNTHTKVRKVI